MDNNLFELDLSVRAFFCLRSAGIYSVNDLISRKQDDLKQVRNLGERAYEEIIEKVHSSGYKFKDENMDDKDSDVIQNTGCNFGVKVKRIGTKKLV